MASEKGLSILDGESGTVYWFSFFLSFSHFAIETGKLIEASREELVECCHYEPCHSVSAEDPFTCVHHIGGICSEESYRPGNTCVCHNNTCTQIGTVNGSCVIPRGMCVLSLSTIVPNSRVYTKR